MHMAIGMHISIILALSFFMLLSPFFKEFSV